MGRKGRLIQDEHGSRQWLRSRSHRARNKRLYGKKDRYDQSHRVVPDAFAALELGVLVQAKNAFARPKTAAVRLTANSDFFGRYRLNAAHCRDRRTGHCRSSLSCKTRLGL